MLAQPSCLRQIKFQIAMCDGPVIPFANVAKKEGAGRPVRDIFCTVPALRSRNRESYRIPKTFRRRPATTTGVSKIAEGFQNILRGNFALMAGRRAVSRPPDSQRKPCGMRPVAILQFRHGHEVRASHSLISQSGIVGSRNCNQLKQVWPVPLGRRPSFEHVVRHAGAVVVISSAGTAQVSSIIMDRIATLNEILTENPKDAFARYGLAMEYSKQGDFDRALAEFSILLESHPDYTAGYFMAAQTLVRAERVEEAKKMLQDGIASARRTGNLHAQSEMEAMLAELG